MKIITALFMLTVLPGLAYAGWSDMSSAVDDSTFSDRKPQLIADATIDTTNTMSFSRCPLFFDADGDWVLTFGYAIYFEQSGAGLDTISVAVDYTIGNKEGAISGSLVSRPVSTGTWEMVQEKVQGSKTQLPPEGFRLRISNSDASSTHMQNVRIRAYIPDRDLVVD